MASVNQVEHIKTITSVLPLLAIIFPILGAVAVPLVKRFREQVRNYLVFASTIGAFGCCVLMAPTVLAQGKQITYSVPIVQQSLKFNVDALGLVFALAASFVWMMVTLYSANYIQHEERRNRYHIFSLCTEAATLGVFLAADFFVLFVFFEVMGILAYMLVIHNQTLEARKAGTRYIYMTIYGGLSLLVGIFLYWGFAGTFGFSPAPGSGFLAGSGCYLVAALMLIGFGIKAGMVPLHVWLPVAHPAAPSPASALLSGVMIKAGAFGFLRIIGTFQVPFQGGENASLTASTAPVHEAAPGIMHNLHNLGWTILWLGILTMVVGMVLALVQNNMKRLLAYSSISQMGYILMGLGAGAYLGAEGSMGLAGGVYHIMNHALFKSCLFLGVGAVYYCTHELDMTKLGGIWRKMPFTTAFTVIAGLGICGIPLFNGFASKTLLHHSVVEAAHVGGPWIKVAEIIFLITAGGTICYIAKLIILTFFGHSRSPVTEKAKRVPLAMDMGMGFLGLGVVLFGIFPGWVINKLLVPVLHTFGALDPKGIHHLAEMSVYTGKNLIDILPSLGVGIFLLILIMTLEVTIELPRPLHVTSVYDGMEIGFLRTCFKGTRRYQRWKSRLFGRVVHFPERFDAAIQFTMAKFKDLGTALIIWGYSFPTDVEGLLAFVRAKQFAGDVAFGIIIIVALLAVLAFLI